MAFRHRLARTIMGIVAAAIGVAFAGRPAFARQAAATAPPASSSSTAVTSSSDAQTPTPETLSPAVLARVRRGLERQAGMDLDEQQLRFYVEVIAKAPRFADYAKGYDFMNGPTKGGDPMSHQEFLNMVRPKELYSSAGITPKEQIQYEVTNYLGQALIKKALEEIKHARSEQEVKEIEDRIDRELAALNGTSPPPSPN